MIRDIRQELLREYEERRFLQELATRRKRKKLYQDIPELEALETSYREMEMEILRAVFASPSHAKSAAKEQARLHDRLEKDREDLLLRHDIHTDPLAPVYHCEECKDTAYLEDGSYCPCFRRELAERVYQLSGSRVRGDLSGYLLDVFTDPKQRENMRKISEDMKEEARSFRLRPGRNYVFSGPISQGKTYLMESFAGELIKDGVIVFSVTAPGFVDFLRRYRFQGRPEPQDEQIYHLLMESDLLLLDDLGKENPTDFVVTEFFHLINHRYLNKKSLFISTNLDSRELFRQYDEASWSRILGNAYVPKFFGPPLKRGEE
ncbi:MAG TPA: ATP-binding protein [Tissierellia bacterium]|nr:ATP-binding protein [Tissierellia bacterium]